MKMQGIAVAMFSLSILMGMGSGSHAGQQVTANPGAQVETVWHGGGCRKDSPAGECCHAGSEPYHCH